MARIKFAYVGGGSTRAAGTMASFVQQGENFDGSEVVLIDLDEERLKIVDHHQEDGTGQGLRPDYYHYNEAARRIARL